MREKFWSLGGDYRIQDEDGQDVFFVDGEAFSFGDQLSFQDMSGRELVQIDQQLLSWGPTYEIRRRGRSIAIVKKKLWTFFKARFEIDVPGPDDLQAEGSFLDHEYRLTRRDMPVALVSKRWFSWPDTYGIDIREGEDDVLVLASAVVIDLVCHEHQA